jgi:hypothetical protein
LAPANHIRLRHWLEREGADFEKERVAEVHLAADFIGQDIKTLDIENQQRWIQQSHSFSPYYEHRKLTGVSMGKGNFMLRVCSPPSIYLLAKLFKVTRNR